MGSAVLAKLGGMVGGKTAAAVAAGALLVTGAAGAGVWWAVQGPKLQVVQRSAQVTVPGGGEQGVAVGCALHETALGGGYAIDGRGYATSSQFIGSSAWMASAYNPGDAPVTLTAYALCVNAAVEFEPRGEYTRRAHAFRDRTDKMIGGTDSVRDLTTDGPYAGLADKALGTESCHGGYTMIGTEFQAGRLITGRPVAPLPLDGLSPIAPAAGRSDPAQWAVSVNPGTELSAQPFPMPRSENVERRTRIVDPQPPQANYAVGIRAICVKLKEAAVVTAETTVGAGGTADAAVRCPKGRLVVGGGFEYVTKGADGSSPQPYQGDGLLYATGDRPTPGAPGTVVKDWRVTGHNEQRAGTQFHNSVWIEHSSREELTGNGYFDAQQHGPDDQELRGTTVPDGQRLIVSAVCARIDAEPTEPGPKPTLFGRPGVPVWSGPSGSDYASGGASPSGVTPSAVTPSAGPSTPPSASGSGRATAGPGTPSGRPATASPGRSTPPGQQSSPPAGQPQAPVVSIEEPLGGGKLRRGCQEQFAGTARSRPGDRAITDPAATNWQIVGPNGAVALGSGPSGSFTIPLLPDGAYPLQFTATDPANGLTGRAQITVQIIGCLH